MIHFAPPFFNVKWSNIIYKKNTAFYPDANMWNTRIIKEFSISFLLVTVVPVIAAALSSNSIVEDVGRLWFPLNSHTNS
jgi:hypothetical protein